MPLTRAQLRIYFDLKSEHMNEDQFKNDIQSRWDRFEKRRTHGRVWTGFFLLVIGALLLLKTASIILFPFWFFTWPVLLITVGLFSGVKHGFRGPLWIILIIIGSFSLADIINPAMHMDRYTWPIMFIAIGLAFIFRPKRNHWPRWRPGRGNWQPNDAPNNPSDTQSTYDSFTGDRRDFIDVTSVFGGVKKNVLS